ncbi:hypothetical protein EAG_10670 [Camponotus floridanus]|uniref:Uncharacterized protein n=1 Tax=Camponotus floridanus TaxID=104421 RepID=E2A5Z9_CAMFO|nr:hypothetical protein EAG_10670 [Camponotus floridanus]
MRMSIWGVPSGVSVSLPASWGFGLRAGVPDPLSAGLLSDPSCCRASVGLGSRDLSVYFDMRGRRPGDRRNLRAGHLYVPWLNRGSGEKRGGVYHGIVDGTGTSFDETIGDSGVVDTGRRTALDLSPS